MKDFKPGQTVWIEYKAVEYVKATETGHKVKFTERDSETIKTISYLPLVEDGWEPQGYFRKNGKYFTYRGKKTAWLRDGVLAFYYEMKTSDVFKDYEYMKRDEIEQLETITDDTFWTEDQIATELQKVYEATSPIRKQIRELEEQLRIAEEPKHDIYKHCFHEWEKGEEVEGNTGSFGTRISQDCECQLCGKETTNNFTRF